MTGDGKYPKPMLFAKVVGDKLVDMTGQNTDPVMSAGMKLTTGPFGEVNGALLFDGVDKSFITMQNGASGPLNFKNEYTVSFW